jgi:UDP-N-acetylmuramate: L-alanyl-gamma-D-glutamyl-meso-diaminopimelate ligase
LNALRARYPRSRLWAIFEPRSNTLRRKVLQKELVASLAVADRVVITSIFNPAAVPEDERLSTSTVVNALRRHGRQARELADADAIVAAVAPELESGDVVAILSNGGFGGIYEKLPRKLEELHGVQRQ